MRCDGRGPVDGPGRFRVGQRGRGELQLDPRTRTALTPPVRYQDRRTPRGRTVHRRVQPPTPAQQLRDDAARRLRGAARRASPEHDPTGAGRLTDSQSTRTLHDFGGSPVEVSVNIELVVNHNLD